LKYKIIERLSRYSKYVRYSRSYNRSRVPVSSHLYFFPPFRNYRTNIPLVSRIVAESKRLNSKEQDTEEAFRAKRLALAEAQRRLDESLARLDHIRRQKRTLLSKGSDIVRRGLASLDEVEEIENRKSNAVVEAQVNFAVDIVD